jgi:outer membrane immunogenic protein
LGAPVYRAPLPAWSWTGFYIGVQGGTGWGTSDLNGTSFGIPELGIFFSAVPNGSSASYGLNGWHGGGTVGYNWQAGQLVFGVEGDISGANINGRGDCTFAASGFGFSGSQSGCTTKMTWFGTLTGRLGVAVDHALIYVKAGGAWAHFDHTMTGAIVNVQQVRPGPSANLGDNRSGGTAGIGIEYAFWNNWSAKLEYDYMDFGTRNFSFAGPFGLTFINNEDVRERVHVIRGGVNYRFRYYEAPAVVTKY